MTETVYENENYIITEHMTNDEGICDLRLHPNPAVRDFYTRMGLRKGNIMPVMDLSGMPKSMIEDFEDYFIWIFETNSYEGDIRSRNKRYIVKLRALLPEIKQFNSISEYIEAKIVAKTLPMKKNDWAAYTLYRFLDYQKGKTDWKEQDVWDVNFAPHYDVRTPSCNPVRKISFRDIKDPEYKRWVKQYTLDLLEMTEQGISIISRKTREAAQLCNFMTDHDFVFDENSCREYHKHVAEMNISDESRAKIFNHAKSFVEYLWSENLLLVNPMMDLYYEYPKFRKKIESALDMDTIFKIFDVLDKISEQWRLMFLVCYITGNRVSEVCTMTRYHALEKRGEEYFMNFYSWKFRTTRTTRIPKTLYEMLSEWIVKTSHINNKYVFPGKKRNSPCQEQSFRNGFRAEIAQFGITVSNKGEYYFLPHALRHTHATELADAGVPLEGIKKRLGHLATLMTQNYVEFSIAKRISMMRRLINAHGEQIDLFKKNDVTEKEVQDTYEEYVRKVQFATVVPGGICNRPDVIGECRHRNVCYTCPYFLTSPEFLPDHEYMLQVNKIALETAAANNWTNKVSTTKKNIEVLENLIRSLKNTDAEEVM